MALRTRAGRRNLASAFARYRWPRGRSRHPTSRANRVVRLQQIAGRGYESSLTYKYKAVSTRLRGRIRQLLDRFRGCGHSTETAQLVQIAGNDRRLHAGHNFLKEIVGCAFGQL